MVQFAPISPGAAFGPEVKSIELNINPISNIGMGGAVVKAKRKPPFNVKTFLSTVDGGRTVSMVSVVVVLVTLTNFNINASGIFHGLLKRPPRG
jgi:hypothetical protein